MKKLSYLLLVLVAIGINSCIVATGIGVYKLSSVNSKFINKLKTEKIVIATTEYHENVLPEYKEAIDNMNMLGADMLMEYWDYGEITDIMPMSEAEKFIRKNKDYHIIYIGDTRKDFVDGDYRNKEKIYMVSMGICFIADPQVGFSKLVSYEIPFTHNPNFLNEVSMYATIRGLQEMFREIENGVIKNKDGFLNNSKRNTDLLKEKTLLLPEFMYNEEVGEDKIKKYYKHDFEVCSNEKYEKAILEGIDGYIVPLFFSVPFNYQHVNQMAFYDSKTWECAGVIAWYGFGVPNHAVFQSDNYEERMRINKKGWKNISKRMRVKNLK